MLIHRDRLAETLAGAAVIMGVGELPTLYRW
jgi:hypothetical protein